MNVAHSNDSVSNVEPSDVKKSKTKSRSYQLFIVNPFARYRSRQQDKIDKLFARRPRSNSKKKKQSIFKRFRRKKKQSKSPHNVQLNQRAVTEVKAPPKPIRSNVNNQAKKMTTVKELLSTNLKQDKSRGCCSAYQSAAYDYTHEFAQFRNTVAKMLQIGSEVSPSIELLQLNQAYDILIKTLVEKFYLTSKNCKDGELQSALNRWCAQIVNTRNEALLKLSQLNKAKKCDTDDCTCQAAQLDAMYRSMLSLSVLQKKRQQTLENMDAEIETLEKIKKDLARFVSIIRLCPDERQFIDNLNNLNDVTILKNLFKSFEYNSLPSIGNNLMKHKQSSIYNC